MGAQIVSGILIGAVVAIAAALVNHRLGAKRDEARWGREDEVQRGRWDREDRQREELWEREDRFRDYQERRVAYKTFARFADLMFSGEDRERWEDLQSRTLAAEDATAKPIFASPPFFLPYNPPTSLIAAGFRARLRSVAYRVLGGDRGSRGSGAFFEPCYRRQRVFSMGVSGVWMV